MELQWKKLCEEEPEMIEEGEAQCDVDGSYAQFYKSKQRCLIKVTREDKIAIYTGNIEKLMVKNTDLSEQNEWSVEVSFISENEPHYGINRDVVTYMLNQEDEWCYISDYI